MRKIIITITLISFFNLIGCYYQEQMNPGEYNYDESEKIWLTTKDTTYIIGAKDYYLENDTLFATLSKKLNTQKTQKTNVEIPVANIESVEVERSDTLATIFTVFGVLVGFIGVIFVIAMAAWAAE